MEVIHEPPSTSSYTPLSTHQSQTPSSFYSTTPVLHHSSVGASLLLLSTDLESHPALAALAGTTPASTNGTTTNGDTAEHDERLIPNIDIWVTSERFILYHPPSSTGLSIPYPSISLHAIQRLRLPSSASEVQGLFMQISTSDGYDDHDEDATISMTLIPSLTVPPGMPEPVRSPEPAVATLLADEAHTDGVGRRPPETPIQSLFAAISACANLHPDPVDADADGDEEMGHPPIMVEGGVGYESTHTGTEIGLPPPMPGSGGWITAENVGEFFDEEGNFRGQGGGGLGPGAGVVRGREEDGEEGRWEDAGREGEGEGNGVGEGMEDGEETKWRRTE